MHLSVVVTIVDGGEALERCLSGLCGQVDPPPLEVIVPFDDSVQQIEKIVETYPEYRFVDLGVISTARPKRSAAGQHELFDRRRAAGLKLAQGELVAMLEDRGVPRPEWARRFVLAHQRPDQVIGGAIENGSDRLMSWAVYFCDFGRFQLPFEDGPAAYVSDVNVCYKRIALETTRDLWSDRFHETTVHWELASRGENLCLTPGVVVDQMRSPSGLWALLRERMAWGRLFAYTRSQEISGVRRIMWIAASPLLPGVLFLRQARLRFQKRVDIAKFMGAAPVIMALLIAWSAGELVGYVTNEP